MTDEKKQEEVEDPHGTPRKADDQNEQQPQDPTEDHGSGPDTPPGVQQGGDEATGTGPSGGGDPGVPEH